MTPETTGPIAPVGPNETVASDGVVVEQGPRWLVEALFGSWLLAGLLVVTVVVVAGAALAVHRHDDVLEEAGPEMATNVGIVLGVIACGKLSTSMLALPYLGDVLVAWVAGSALGLGVVAGVEALVDD